MANKVFLRSGLGLVLGLGLIVAGTSHVSAAPRTVRPVSRPLPQSGDIDMIVGDIESVDVRGLQRISVTNPDIADISDAQSNKVSLVAKKSGETILFIWDAYGKRTFQIRVVKEELTTVMAEVSRLLQEAGIQGISLEENRDVGRVVMTGSVSKDDKTWIDTLAQPFSDSILNLVKEAKSEDLVQVDMQIVEINTSFEKDLGVLWNTSSTSNNLNNTSPGTGTNQGLVTENESLPSTNGSTKLSNFFKVGGFARTPLQATINAFIQEGKARLISKPRLVVMSGKQASFLVGGEIPIETTTTNTTGSTLTQNTSYTQYGVNVTVTPTIREGKIDVLLNVDIRDIDSSNSSNGNVAFITRTASTNLFMDNRQTVVLAGLIKYSQNEQVTQVPFLSKIPLLGALFTNHNTPSPDTNTEMVIILTPAVLTDKKIAENQIAMPTPEEKDAWNDVSAKYPREPLTSSLSSAALTTPPMTMTPLQTPEDFMPLTTAYARMVQEKISKAVTYPPQTKGSILTGTVKLRLHILKDGTLDSAVLMKSSGSTILDQEAMQAARHAAPFGSFSTGMEQQDLTFTVPIVYNRFMPASRGPEERVIASY